MSEDINVTDGTVLEALNNKVDLDGGNYIGSGLDKIIHDHCASGLEIGDIGIAPLGIDETKGKRRYLNGQLIIQEQYVQFTDKVKSAVALYPSLACTESEWQTTATMTVGGQVGKFVVDDEAGTIRLPKIIMPIQGLTDLSKLGEIVEAGLPNITGGFFCDGGSGASANGLGAFQQLTAVENKNLTSGSGHGFQKFDFDASRSSSTYGNSDTVQQEQIQYPYFIQVATGAETEDNIINTIELNNPYSFGDSKYSQIILNNISWLRSLGQWNQKIDYTDYYDWILTNANNGEELFKLSTEEYDDYCWVVNTAEETFRLPIKVKLASGKAVVGNGMGLGLMTAGTSATLSAESIGNNNGVLRPRQPIGQSISSVASSGQPIPATLAYITGVTTDATKSGLELSDSGLYLYFYVGETVQNANLINAGRIEEKLVDKVDVNSSWGFPSDRYIDLTLGASGTEYTAPANGYVVISKRTSANNQSIEINIPSTGLELRCTVPTSGGDALTSLVVKRGQKYKVNYNAGGTTNYFRFIYAEGEQ